MFTIVIFLTIRFRQCIIFLGINVGTTKLFNANYDADFIYYIFTNIIESREAKVVPSPNSDDVFLFLK